MGIDRLSGAALEEELASLLYGAGDAARFGIDAEALAEAAHGVRQMVLGRVHRGTGGLPSWYPRTLAAWRAAHPADADLDELAKRFCASRPCAAWREHGARGISLEEALFRFFESAEVGDAATREDEMAGAVVRALAVCPAAGFTWPALVRRAPGGAFAITRAHTLHAALDGRYLRGPVPPLLVALLDGERPPTPGDALEPVVAELRRLRLL